MPRLPRSLWFRCKEWRYRRLIPSRLIAHDPLFDRVYFATRNIRMSQALPLPPPGFDALSIDEQIDYLQSLWDHIAARPEDVPVPEWHREILAERLAAHRADDGNGREWDEFEKELRTNLTEPTE